MRRYHIKQGNYIGDHFIFDTEQEAAVQLGLQSWNANGCKFLLNPDGTVLFSTPILSGPTEEFGIKIKLVDTFKHWSDLSVKKGDWVRTDDGRIVQVLNRYIMPRNRNRKARPTLDEHPEPMPLDTIYTRFCFASGAIYIKANGELRYNYIHADLFVPGQYCRSALTRKNSIMKKDKRLFAYHLAMTCSPLQAYALTWPKHYKNKLIYKSITKRATLLTKDRAVLKEFLTYMEVNEYRDKLIKAAEKAGASESLIIDEIVRGVTKATAGSKEHQEMIKMLVAIFEKINEVELLTNTDNSKPKLPADTTPESGFLKLPEK